MGTTISGRPRGAWLTLAAARFAQAIFPDLAGEDAQSRAWHRAELAGRSFALWLCADVPTHRRFADAMASCNATLRSIAEGVSETDGAAGLPPILAIEQTLPMGLCAGLIQYFTDSTHKVQGRMGLSTPHLDLGLKRRSHVNLDRDMAMAVDDALVMLLSSLYDEAGARDRRA